MKLSKQFTTVTPFSKFLALSLFVLLPVFMFYLGLNLNIKNIQTSNTEITSSATSIAVSQLCKTDEELCSLTKQIENDINNKDFKGIVDLQKQVKQNKYLVGAAYSEYAYFNTSEYSNFLEKYFHDNSKLVEYKIQNDTTRASIAYFDTSTRKYIVFCLLKEKKWEIKNLIYGQEFANDSIHTDISDPQKDILWMVDRSH